MGRTALRLEPMRIADTVTQGQFVSLPGSDRHTIALEIRRTGGNASLAVEFGFRHRDSGSLGR